MVCWTYVHRVLYFFIGGSLYLLYVDESGEPSNKEEQYFILGGISIYETNAFFLSQAFDKVQEKWFPEATSSIEFHASKIYNRNGEPWHSMSKEDCRAVFVDLCNALDSVSHKALSLFAVAVHKQSFPSEPPVEKAFHELCGYFDSFLTQSNLQLPNNKNRGLMVLDSNKYKGHLDTLLLEYRQFGGTKYGRVKNFADAPVFANSQTTRLIQAADFVAYSVYRRYERSDTLLLDKLINRFHCEDGKIHGLQHLIAGYKSCTCPACLSRR